MIITERLFKEFLIKKGEENLTIEVIRMDCYYPKAYRRCLKIRVVGNYDIITKPISEFKSIIIGCYVNLHGILHELKVGGYIKSKDINTFTSLYNMTKKY